MIGALVIVKHCSNALKSLLTLSILLLTQMDNRSISFPFIHALFLPATVPHDSVPLVALQQKKVPISAEDP
jgi:hypothetical protein